MDGRRARRVLGVASDAGPDEIRRAFRVRAHLTHPDHGGTSAAFAEVLAAFELLRDAPSMRHRLFAPRTRSRVDVYDSRRRPAPRRDFGDLLRAATARLQ
jgi:acyl-coenzyme A thioesterase PaaI-like protein